MTIEFVFQLYSFFWRWAAWVCAGILGVLLYQYLEDRYGKRFARGVWTTLVALVVGVVLWNHCP